ncbi:hypothetical protein HanIR_Chr01g0046121 [Helianthus annuus]|nr:hypothetical protein HanIR_Chr01g0046121 [Helianthus annuus]
MSMVVRGAGVWSFSCPFCAFKAYHLFPLATYLKIYPNLTRSYSISDRISSFVSLR